MTPNLQENDVAVLTSEQEMLRDTARTWVQRRSPIAAFRKMRDSGAQLGYDPTIWQEIAQLGWAGIIIPEAYGGSGLGFLAMGLVLEELGRTLTASPLIASGVAAASALILGSSQEQRQEWLPRIAAGEVIGALAVDEGARHAPDRIAATARAEDGLFRISGCKQFVQEGMAADLFIVSARFEGRIEIFLVRADAAGVARERLHLADSRGAAHLRLEDVVAERLNGGETLLNDVLDRARATLTAEMLGSAVAAFEQTVDYLKVRVQFGQLIGSFQALQHRAALMFGEIELARSTMEAALISIDNDMPDSSRLVALAKVKTGDILHRVSNEMIQMHGGIGMTDDHDAGFYLKRARTSAATYGNQAFHREQYGKFRNI